MRRTTWLLSAAIGVTGFLPGLAEGSESPEAQFVQLLNDERMERGLSALRRSDDLDAIAERHSRRMRRDAELYHNGNLEHEIPGSWTSAGENVGIGYDIGALHFSFMDSPTHRRNILAGSWDEIGLGVVVESGEIYVTQVFVDRGTHESRRSTGEHPKKKQSKPKQKPKPKQEPKAEPEPEPAQSPKREPAASKGSTPDKRPPQEPAPANRNAAVATLIRIVQGI